MEIEQTPLCTRRDHEGGSLSVPDTMSQEAVFRYLWECATHQKVIDCYSEHGISDPLAAFVPVLRNNTSFILPTIDQCSEFSGAWLKAYFSKKQRTANRVIYLGEVILFLCRHGGLFSHWLVAPRINISFDVVLAWSHEFELSPAFQLPAPGSNPYASTSAAASHGSISTGSSSRKRK